MADQIVEGRRASNIAAIAVIVFTMAVGIAMPMVCWNLFGRDMACEIAIRKVIGDQLSAIKSGDVSAVVDAMGNRDDFMSTVGVDEEEFYQAFFEGFDYKIEDVQVSGDKGSATVDVTIKDIKQMAGPIGDKIVESAEDGTLFSEGVETKAAIGEAIVEGVKSSDKYSTTTVTLEFERIDGHWQATNLTEVASLVVLGDETGTWLSNEVATIESTVADLQDKAGKVNGVLQFLQGLKGMLGGSSS